MRTGRHRRIWHRSPRHSGNDLLNSPGLLARTGPCPRAPLNPQDRARRTHSKAQGPSRLATPAFPVDRREQDHLQKVPAPRTLLRCSLSRNPADKSQRAVCPWTRLGRFGGIGMTENPCRSAPALKCNWATPSSGFRMVLTRRNVEKSPDCGHS